MEDKIPAHHDAELNKIAERANKASPVPWRWDTVSRHGFNGPEWYERLVDANDVTVLSCEIAPGDEDARFIRHAKEDVKALFSLIRQLEHVIHDLQQESHAYNLGYQAAVADAKGVYERGGEEKLKRVLSLARADTLPPDKARAEVERLRGLLKRVMEYPPDGEGYHLRVTSTLRRELEKEFG